MASPEGDVSRFQWTVPNGSSSNIDERGYFTLRIAFQPLVPRGHESTVIDWFLVILDRFEDGPNIGQSRPQYFYGYATGVEHAGFPVARAKTVSPTLEQEDLALRNRTSFDGRTLDFLVLARAAEACPFILAVDVLEGLGLRDWQDDEPVKVDLPGSAEDASERALAPVAMRTGFQVAAYEELAVRDYYYSFASTNVVVKRATGNATTPANQVVVEAHHDSGEGWTLVHSAFDVSSRVGHFELDASYRGRALRGSGPLAEAAGQVDALGALDHYVYRDGMGPSRFRMELNFADSPAVHYAYLFKLDVDVRLQTLLGTPMFENWEVRPRAAGYAAGAA